LNRCLDRLQIKLDPHAGFFRGPACARFGLDELAHDAAQLDRDDLALFEGEQPIGRPDAPQR
jgi:hypothetical protein